MAKKSLNLSKKVQLDKAKALLLATIVFSSMLTVFALVASKAFLSQAIYLNKVASEKTKAVKQLKKNLDSVGTLKESYKSFSTQEPNLLGGLTTGIGDRDGDNGKLVLDALPSKYDFPALATSLEKLLEGQKINSITGSDQSETTESDTKQLVEMPFSIDVTSSYEGVQKMLLTFEKSIRPFQINKLTISGKNDSLQTLVEAKTYYQPERDLEIKTKVVK